MFNIWEKHRGKLPSDGVYCYLAASVYLCACATQRLSVRHCLAAVFSLRKLFFVYNFELFCCNSQNRVCETHVTRFYTNPQ